jgi:putative acetyltransferase
VTADVSSLTIRVATDADSYDVIGLVASCWAEYEGCVIDIDGELAHLRAVATAFEGWGGRLWAVGEGGHFIATVGLTPGASPAEAELRMLYVHRNWRKRGLGTRLVALVEAEAASRGAREVFLWSDTRFEDAHRHYERLGYTRAAETRELHDLSNTVEYQFRKELAPR